MTNQRMVFPDPAKNVDDDEDPGPISKKMDRTFTINPQERASRHPFAKHIPFEEPLSSSPVVKVASDVVIRRWIRRKYPFSEALSRLIPC